MTRAKLPAYASQVEGKSTQPSSVVCFCLLPRRGGGKNYSFEQDKDGLDNNSLSVVFLSTYSEPSKENSKL